MLSGTVELCEKCGIVFDYSLGQLVKVNFTFTTLIHCGFFFQGSQAKLHSLTPAQKAYMSSLSQGLDTITSAEKDLGSPAQIPALGSDPVKHCHISVKSHITT